jgi:hypothetical protein
LLVVVTFFLSFFLSFLPSQLQKSQNKRPVMKLLSSLLLLFDDAAAGCSLLMLLLLLLLRLVSDAVTQDGRLCSVFFSVLSLTENVVCRLFTFAS